MAIDASKLRHGRVRGRYFRENFAQAGIDLSQIIPELVTNADAAIAAAGRGRGRIQLRIGRADPEFLHAWKAALRSLRLPALRTWQYELVCSDGALIPALRKISSRRRTCPLVSSRCCSSAPRNCGWVAARATLGSASTSCFSAL